MSAPASRIGLGAPQRFVEAQRGARIGARDDEEVAALRASTATRIFRTMSAMGTTRRPGVCPHFFGNSWSSSWIAAAPAAS